MQIASARGSNMDHILTKLDIDLSGIPLNDQKKGYPYQSKGYTLFCSTQSSLY